MKELLIRCSPDRKLQSLIVASSLIMLVILIFFLQGLEIAFSQLEDDPSLLVNPNTTTSLMPTSNESVVTSDAPGFVANGKINTVIDVPNGKWLAAGNWNIIVNNGNVTSFETKMTWYNSTGTNAHTHDLTNFKSVSGDTQMVPINITNKQTGIEGFTDVVSNGRTSWFEVPTTITINDRKIISISVDDNQTNGHFGGQPLLGIVDSFLPCSDVPGPNMELLPPCSVTVPQDSEIPFNGTIDLNYSQQLIPTDDEPVNTQEGLQPEDEPVNTQEGLQPEDEPVNTQEGLQPEDEPVNTQEGLQPEDEPVNTQEGLQPEDEPVNTQEGLQPEDEPVNTRETNATTVECKELTVRNVSASGFETDPSDYHPPSDAIDDDSATWWSNKGDDSWLQLDLGEEKELCNVSIEWNKGDTRKYGFEVEVSNDGNDFVKIFEGTNKGDSLDPETYGLDGVSGQFLKILATNTGTEGGWVSIKEIKLTGRPTT